MEAVREKRPAQLKSEAKHRQLREHLTPPVRMHEDVYEYILRLQKENENLRKKTRNQRACLKQLHRKLMADRMEAVARHGNLIKRLYGETT